MTEQKVDAAKVEAFSDRLAGMLNGGAISLMASVGHRTGLFDVMSKLSAADSHRIAEQAGLNERYVREWLGAMVAGDIVEYDAKKQTYRLPAEHAAVLTREARPNNMAATFQWIPVLAQVENEIVACFEQGGGVPYSAYDRFHTVMAEESDQTVVAVLVDAILPAVPGLVDALESGIDVLDVGCGSGRALNLMAQHYPKSRFVGFDASAEAVTFAQQGVIEQGLGNARFEVRDVANMGSQDEFDLITAFDAIHDQAKPDAVLEGIAQALRSDGTFLMQDIAGTSRVEKDADHPLGAFLYTISCLHCMTVSLSSGGAGLGAMWGAETALRMLDEAGFKDVEMKTLPHDIMNNYYIARRGA